MTHFLVGISITLKTLGAQVGRLIDTQFYGFLAALSVAYRRTPRPVGVGSGGHQITCGLSMLLYFGLFWAGHA